MSENIHSGWRLIINCIISISHYHLTYDCFEKDIE